MKFDEKQLFRLSILVCRLHPNFRTPIIKRTLCTLWFTRHTDVATVQDEPMMRSTPIGARNTACELFLSLLWGTSTVRKG